MWIRTSLVRIRRESPSSPTVDHAPRRVQTTDGGGATAPLKQTPRERGLRGSTLSKLLGRTSERTNSPADSESDDSYREVLRSKPRWRVLLHEPAILPGRLRPYRRGALSAGTGIGEQCHTEDPVRADRSLAVSDRRSEVACSVRTRGSIR